MLGISGVALINTKALGMVIRSEREKKVKSYTLLKS